MSRRQPVRVDEISSFDCLIDARSPAEFALDHIPGAINCPVLDDDERRIVGTLYKQTGAFEARRLGGAMVAANLAIHLRARFADKPIGWQPLVYCWRGGLRSGSMVQWMRLVGWDAQQLAGGYKSYRQHVVAQIANASPTLPLRVLCGATGSAKTRVLQALAARGARVLDLEHAASHKGSMLGALPGQPQPTQKQFETRIVAVLDKLGALGADSPPLFVEGESARIGRLAVPVPLITRLRAAECIEIDATPAARLAFLLRDYAYLGDDPHALAALLGKLKETHGKETVQRWQQWALSGALEPLFAELMTLHYDPHYRRSQERNFVRWPQRRVLQTDDLSDAGIDALADTLLRNAGAP